MCWIVPNSLSDWLPGNDCEIEFNKNTVQEEKLLQHSWFCPSIVVSVAVLNKLLVIFRQKIWQKWQLCILVPWTFGDRKLSFIMLFTFFKNIIHLMTISWRSGVRSMISSGERFSAVLHWSFMFILPEVHPCQKKTLTTSLNLQRVLLMLPIFVIIFISFSYPTARSDHIPPPPNKKDSDYQWS